MQQSIFHDEDSSPRSLSKDEQLREKQDLLSVSNDEQTKPVGFGFPTLLENDDG